MMEVYKLMTGRKLMMKMLRVKDKSEKNTLVHILIHCQHTHTQNKYVNKISK